jgi:hypothetical protein
VTGDSVFVPGEVGLDERRDRQYEGQAVDENGRSRLREYLEETVDQGVPRPRTGESLPVTLRADDVARARRVLRSLADGPEERARLAVAATSLEVALEDLGEYVTARDGPVRVALDVWDWTLVTFASLEAAGRWGPGAVGASHRRRD